MPATANATSILSEIRDGIDNIDAAIIHLLAERFRYTQRIGTLKGAYNVPRRTRPERYIG
jgi:chorismate mutase